jgi:hypothetical protein
MAFDHLANHRYMNLTTYRKNGDAVTTPVWFAQVNDRLYVFTSPDSGKVKRLRHTQRVQVAPCTSNGKPLGESVEAQARLLMDAGERKLANAALDHKYGWQKGIFNVMMRLRGMKPLEAAFIEVSPS